MTVYLTMLPEMLNNIECWLLLFIYYIVQCCIASVVDVIIIYLHEYINFVFIYELLMVILYSGVPYIPVVCD